MFRALVCTVVPEAEELDDAGWAELEALVDESLRSRPAALQRRLRLFLLFVQWAPFFGSFRRFTSLDVEGRVRLLAALQDHPIDQVRVGFWGLRTLGLLGYYGRDAAAAAVGYRPNLRGWEGV